MTSFPSLRPVIKLTLTAVIFIFLTLVTSISNAKDVEIPNNAKSAIFAAGCFWCIEKDFEKHDGIYAVYSGYSGGTLENPTYKAISRGDTGHREVVQVWYDESKLDYATLVDILWRNVDPFDANGQFCDKGFQYTAAIYPATSEEREIAEQSKLDIEQKLNQKTTLSIDDAAKFYFAEDYHQNFYQKSPVRYTGYRYACGRDKRLERVWGAEARAEHLPSSKH
jgi:peptide-methionine (S)-S-oxide reductase